MSIFSFIFKQLGTDLTKAYPSSILCISITIILQIDFISINILLISNTIFQGFYIGKAKQYLISITK